MTANIYCEYESGGLDSPCFELATALVDTGCLVGRMAMCPRHALLFRFSATSIHPIGMDVDRAASLFVAQVENYLKSQQLLIRPAIPVIEGFPCGARECIQNWGRGDDPLIAFLRRRYGISEPTARNWVWLVRHPA